MALSQLRSHCVVLSLALLFSAGCSTGSPSGGGGTVVNPPTMAAKAQFAYVGGFSGGINSYTISPTGVWTPTSPASVPTNDNYGAMVVDPLGKFLFFAGFLGGSVTSYSITPGTGVLTKISTVPASNTNNRPENMAIDPSGRFIYVANTGLDTVSTFAVNRNTGALTAVGDTVLPNAPGIYGTFTSPGGIVTDSTGKYLYVGEYGYVVCYAIDQTTGALTPLASPTVAGIDFFNLRLDPTGKFIYATAGRSNYVSVYAINAATGALTIVSSAITGNGATDIGLTFDGTHAYVIDRDDHTISFFGRNEISGGLTPLTPPSITDLGQFYIIQMDPGGQLAYIVDEGGSVQSFQINPDGTLSGYSYGSVSSANTPVGLAIYPTHP